MLLVNFYVTYLFGNAVSLKECKKCTTVQQNLLSDFFYSGNDIVTLYCQVLGFYDIAYALFGSFMISQSVMAFCQ